MMWDHLSGYATKFGDKVRVACLVIIVSRSAVYFFQLAFFFNLKQRKGIVHVLVAALTSNVIGWYWV